MEPKQIKALLIMHDVRVLDVAEIVKCRPNTVSQVIHKVRTSARIQKVIAAQVGMDPAALFPKYRGERAA